MKHLIQLILYISIFSCSTVEPVKPFSLTLFDREFIPGIVPSVFGGTYHQNASGELELLFHEDSSSSGFDFTFEDPLALGDHRFTHCLRISMESGTSLEGLDILLNDGVSDQGDLDLFTSLSMEEYFTNGEALIPLEDFPNEGLNWTSPPLENLPHRGRFQWNNVVSISFYGYEMGGEFRVASMELVPLTEVDLHSELVGDLQILPDQVDLLQGESLRISGGFNRICQWTIRIEGEESGAVHYFAGRSNRIELEWTGQAQQGFFTEESCTVQLRFSQEDSPLLAQRSFQIRSAHNPSILVNQGGYHPMEEKVFALVVDVLRCPDGQEGPLEFQVMNQQGIVFQGETSEPRFDRGAENYIVTGQFSAVTPPGEYHIYLPEHGRSLDFSIHPLKYRDLMELTMKSYYFQRCGEELAGVPAEPWDRPACHSAEAHLSHWEGLDYEILGETMDVTGGWHDAGDFGKKVVPTSIALYHVLMAYELAPQHWEALDLQLPGDSVLPDILLEAQFGLDWLFKMQREDGGVYTHVVSQEFHDIHREMPHEDHLLQFITPPSSAAVADFIAIMSLASRVYGDLEPDFGRRCLEAAELSWAYLEQNPGIFPAGGYQDPPGLYTPGYADAQDEQERLWALVEYYIASGDPGLSERISQELQGIERLNPGNWVDPKTFGVLSLAYYLPDGDPLKDQAHALLRDYKRETLGLVQANPLGIALGPNDYYWGTNYHLISRAATLAIIDSMDPQEELKPVIAAQVDYLLGRNPLDFSYVTGVGIKSVSQPLQCASINDDVPGPIPGFLVPGPNPTRDDVFIREMPEDLAPLELYLDNYQAYSGNEVALVFNAPLVLCLSHLYSLYPQ